MRTYDLPPLWWSGSTDLIDGPTRGTGAEKPRKIAIGAAGDDNRPLEHKDAT
jgi:hypothetical protein